MIINFKYTFYTVPYTNSGETSFNGAPPLNSNGAPQNLMSEAILTPFFFASTKRKVA